MACTVIVVGLTLIFLQKTSRYSSIYDQRKKLKSKSIPVTNRKLVDTKGNPHMLYTYGYMLNQGEITILPIIYVAPGKVMFSVLFVCLFTGKGFLSHDALGQAGRIG